MASNIKIIKPEIPFNLKVKKRLDLIIEKKKMVIFFMLAGLLIGATVSFLLPKIYRATSKIFFQYNSVNSKFLFPNGSLKNELNLLKSEELLKNSVDDLAKKGTHLTVNDILDSEEILEDKNSVAIAVSIVSDGAQKAAEIANSVTQKFSDICTMNNVSSLISTLRMVTEKENTLQEDIRKGLVNQQSTQISGLSGQQEQLITKISEFESELESIELDNYFYSSQYEYLQKIIETKYPEISSNILLFDDARLSDIILKLERLETKDNLSAISQKLGNYPIPYPWEDTGNLYDLASLQKAYNSYLESLINNVVKNRKIDDIEFLKNLTRKIFENQIKVNSIDLSKSIIFNIMTSLEERFNLIPFNVIDIARQERMKKFNSALVLKIKSKKLRLQEKENIFYAEIESIKTAEIPKSYFSPKTTLNILLGSLIGLIIGLLIAVSSDPFKIELIKSSEDLEECGYKIIAQIPSISDDTQLIFDNSNKQEQNKLNPKMQDTFLNIETFLKYGSLDKPLKTILITSSQDGEGKSVIASNIAFTLAQSENKVLLVDANLKYPKLNKYFDLKSTPSLAHYLFRKKELNEIIRNTRFSNLDLITCIEFPQNPAVIITSERMKNFMDQVKKNYDYVVYDSSSLCSLKETAALANSMDEIIIVVRANKTTLSEIITAESVLMENGVSEFNVVLNDVKS